MVPTTHPIASTRLLTDHQMSSLVERVQILEQENAQLTLQLTKTKESLDLCQRVQQKEDELLELLRGGPKPVGGKAAMLDEMNKLNKDLADELKCLFFLFSIIPSSYSLLTSAPLHLSLNHSLTLSIILSQSLSHNLSQPSKSS